MEGKRGIRKISPALFGLIVLFMFLPFASVTCQGQKVVTVSAMDLTVGTTVDTSDGQEHIRPGGRAILLLLSALAGVAVGLLKIPRKELASLIAGAFGFLMFLLLWSKVSGSVSGANAAVGITYDSGFYLMLLGFLAVIGLNGYLLYQERTQQTAMSPPGAGPGFPSSTTGGGDGG